MAKLLNGRMWKMLRMFVVALALAILGDWLAVAADLPIPGSTIGMVIPALAFSTRGGVDEHAVRLFDLAVRMN